MSNARIRVVGKLGRASRGLTLTTAENEIWVIETDQAHEEFHGLSVMVEGTVTGFDRLRADWLGPHAL